MNSNRYILYLEHIIMTLGNFLKNEITKWPNWLNLCILRLNCFGSLVYGRRYRHFKLHLNDADPEQLLLDTVNHAIQHVPYYRNRYGSIQIHNRKEFEDRIGFIDKDEVMAHWDSFLVDGIDWHKVSTGSTGGTSGKPLKLVSPNNRYSWELAYMHSQWEKTGWHYHTRGVIRNHNLQGRTYAINPVTKEVIFDPHRMSGEYAQTIYNILKRFNISYLHAYPSNAYQFCNLCVKQGLALDFIHAIFCGSESVTEVQRVFFAKQGIKILSFYGHSEKLILGSNDTTSYQMRMESNYGLCELIDKNGQPVKTSGEIGELTGTTFHNRHFPLIRYKTGDYATLAKYDRFMVLEDIIGRWDKTLVYRMDGSTTSLTVLNLHNTIYEHIDGIQYIQEKVGYLKVLIIKNNLYTQSDEDFILRHLSEAMGSTDYVEIVYVERLIFQPNGKFLPLISKINT